MIDPIDLADVSLAAMKSTHSSQKGLFVTFEGIEGSGKSSQIVALATRLEALQQNHLITREPGGTELAESLRTILLSPSDEDMDSGSEFLIFSAARRDHMAKKILPALANDAVVLCDRFYDASTAYQGYGHKLDLSFIQRVNQWATFDRAPDITIFLDIDLDCSEQRLNQRQENYRDRIEQKSSDFYNRVRNGYLELAEKHDRIHVFDGKQPPNTLSEQIGALVEAQMT